MMKSNKGFKLCMLNVRSLLPKIDEVRLSMSKFDIICLCETWLSTVVTDPLIKIPGFEIFRQDRKFDVNIHGTPKRGGGLCIYVRDSLAKYAIIKDEISSVNNDVEQLWISICCPNIKKKIIGVVYRPRVVISKTV